MKPSERYLTKKNSQLKLVGAKCKLFRKEVLKIRQEDVALHLGVTQNAISKFEAGSCDSMVIFLYYLNKGLVENPIWGLK